jgi:hypothetical protein
MTSGSTSRLTALERASAQNARISARRWSIVHQSAPVLVAINYSLEAVAVLSAGLGGRRRKAG